MARRHGAGQSWTRCSPFTWFSGEGTWDCAGRRRHWDIIGTQTGTDLKWLGSADQAVRLPRQAAQADLSPVTAKSLPSPMGGAALAQQDAKTGHRNQALCDLGSKSRHGSRYLLDGAESTACAGFGGPGRGQAGASRGWSSGVKPPGTEAPVCVGLAGRIPFRSWAPAQGVKPHWISSRAALRPVPWLAGDRTTVSPASGIISCLSHLVQTICNGAWASGTPVSAWDRADAVSPGRGGQSDARANQFLGTPALCKPGLTSDRLGPDPCRCTSPTSWNAMAPTPERETTRTCLLRLDSREQGCAGLPRQASSNAWQLPAHSCPGVLPAGDKQIRLAWKH